MIICKTLRKLWKTNQSRTQHKTKLCKEWNHITIIMLKTIKILRSNNLILYTRLERLHDKSYISHLSLSTWLRHHIWRQENFLKGHIHSHLHPNSSTWKEEEVNCRGVLYLQGELLRIMLRGYWEIGVIVNSTMKASLRGSSRGEVKFLKMWIHTLQQCYHNR